MKSKRIRDTVFFAHRYIGLVVGILAAIIGITGSAIVLDDLWKNYLFAPRVTPTGERLAIATLIAKTKAILPDLTLEYISIPRNLTEPANARWLAESEKFISANINPYTGALIGQSYDRNYLDFLFELHINFLSGTVGHYLAGIVGLLSTILCLTGIVLWPGWRKLAAGFKIKWDASIKRFNFDLHKVVGIVTAIFLSLTMFTGFIWNFAQWTDPIIYAVTFSPMLSEEQLTSKPIPATRSPVQITDVLEKATAVLPESERIYLGFPNSPEGVISVWSNDGSTTAYFDRFSGEMLKVEGLPSQQSRAERLFNWFASVHFGTFAGVYSRIFYLFVGLAPAFLLITGFVMWWQRKPIKSTNKKNYV